MLTKEFYDEVAKEPMDYHRLITKMLLEEYYDYTSEYLFGDCRCTQEEAIRTLNNIEDVAKAVCGREPSKSLEKMIVDHDWQPLHEMTISYYLPEEIKRFVDFVNMIAGPQC